MPVRLKNFGRNIIVQADRLIQPADTRELLEEMANSRTRRFRVVGSLHSWSRIVETDELAVSLANLDSIEIAADRRYVRVGAGCTVKKLIRHLARNGLALPSVGLIDEQTVAGATATGTHGSGRNSLSHFIRSVELAHFDPATGEPSLTFIDSGPELLAARCSLGMMGVLVSLEFECRPAFNVMESVRQCDSLAAVLANESEYPLQQFYLIPWSWELYIHQRKETGLERSALAGLYGIYRLAVVDIALHLAVRILAWTLKRVWAFKLLYRWILPPAIIRNWPVVDDSSRLLIMEHELFRHIEIEVFVVRSRLSEALDYLKSAIQVFAGKDGRNGSAVEPFLQYECPVEPGSVRATYIHHYPICIRRIESDQTLVSMAAPAGKGVSSDPHEDWYSISLISYERPGDREGFLRFAECIAHGIATHFGGRCHWGKCMPLGRDVLVNAYPALSQFREIVERFDPHGQFRNRWLDAIFC